MNKREMQLPLDFSYKSIFQFDDLVVTDSNRMAFQLINHWPNWVPPIAILIGDKGSGKTHFSSVWAQKANALNIFHDEINKAIIESSSGKPFLIENIDVGEINEIGLFHLINSVKQANLYVKHATLLITARTLPSAWNLKLNDLKSRLNSVMLVALEQPDDELLTAIAFKLFSDRQIIVHSNIIHYLISHCERSLFSLKCIIDAIDRLALQRKSKVTRAIITEVINMGIQ
ncbi:MULTISPECIES: DnaA regulatory inactivator HdaA [unclassified Bartonella]|uniref:DnaA regulatory inactivator HdaA n=1 Tax=unclassified Bartonella TaxID=2645622 RepID=UPI00099A495A|nr:MULTISPECIES: DnaA regulatory inactivator HdaA [unclassified Bartonella]AQX27963.1 regulatory inactivation of DnaA Hda protein [Bartonella sp. JB15]AQX29239.1 regulatory inactivation of DnaA Hda protein [Bartonella sp. JB63]